MFWNYYISNGAVVSGSYYSGTTSEAIVINELNGYDYPKEDLVVAESVDLITLPKDITGANCANCIWVRVDDPEKGLGFCKHPSIKLPVTAHMCCSLWDAKGALRSWKNYYGDGGDIKQAWQATREEKLAIFDESEVEEFANNSKWRVARTNAYRYFDIDEDIQIRITKIHARRATPSYIVDVYKKHEINPSELIHRSTSRDSLNDAKKYAGEIYFWYIRKHDSFDEMAEGGEISFITYQDGLRWMDEESKKYSSKNEFYSSEEYRKAYPILQKLYRSEKSETAQLAQKAMSEVGVEYGDYVSYNYVTPFGHVEEYSGVIIERDGMPRVKLDEGQQTISGQKSVRWHKGWAKTMAEGGETKKKKIIRRNLPINVEYKLVDSFYTGGLSENPMICDNCGRPIANVAVIESSANKTHHVGMDCAETLSSIKDSLEFQKTQNDFNEASAIRKKINQALKKYPDATLKVENSPMGTVYIEVEGKRGRILAQYVDKSFFFKYLPDLKSKIINPEKNDFYPSFQRNYDFNFDFDYFKRENYKEPQTFLVGKYKAVAKTTEKPHTKPDGTVIYNKGFGVEVFENGKLIGDEFFYMHRDIPSNILWIINKYEFDNFKS